MSAARPCAAAAWTVGLLALSLTAHAEPEGARAGERASRLDPSLLQGGLRAASFYTGVQTLDGAQPDWRETGLRGQYQWRAHQLAGELLTARRFGEDGSYLGLQDTLSLGPGLWGSLALGAGDGASYLPRYRIDAFVHRKFGPGERWIGSLGLGHYRATDRHHDQSLTLGLTYWFESPWVLQGEWRYNQSHPGSVDTRQYALAATWGRAGDRQLTLRHGWGREGYLSLGQGRSLIAFDSHETTLGWQYWMAPDWGWRLGGARYRNPQLRRQGVELSVFKAWP
jgi:YaiO family outer membrane protein